MYNPTANRTSAIEFWSNQPTDQPWLVNGFKGTWSFSDHSLIPEIVSEFVLEYFRSRLSENRRNYIKSIPLEDINELLNKVWDGPGSVVKLVNMMYDMRQERHENEPKDAKDVLKGYETPTIESNLGENAVDRIEK